MQADEKIRNENSDLIADLNDVEEGALCIVESLVCKGQLKNMLQSIGFSKNAKVKMIFKNSKKSTLAFLIKGSTFALRVEDAQKIRVRYQI